MAVLPQTMIRLAELGANIEITAEANYYPQMVEKIVEVVTENGGHVTIEVGKYLPQTLERFVEIGGNKVTIRT